MCVCLLMWVRVCVCVCACVCVCVCVCAPHLLAECEAHHARDLLLLGAQQHGEADLGGCVWVCACGGGARVCERRGACVQASCAPHNLPTSLPSDARSTLPSTTGDLRASACA